jgi:DNA-binding NarL/FixJ family response regulator
MIRSHSNHKIKVFIADDSLIVRKHLVTMLDELAGIEVVGQAENVAEAISGIRILHMSYLYAKILGQDPFPPAQAAPQEKQISWQEQLQTLLTRWQRHGV